MLDHLDLIRRESDAFYATAGQADPASGVPSCPGWTVADLVWHFGEVQWFWATIIEERADSPDEVEKAKPTRPSGHPEMVGWGRSQATRMIELLATTTDDTPVWTWALNDVDHSVGFIRRHQVQEASVHRWDLQNAAGAADPIDAVAASDSIDEVLAITLPWSVRPDKTLPGTVHLHCTDTEGEWFVHADGRVERVHQKGDVAIRGTASNLLLGLYKRIPVDELERIGDTSLADELIERINTA